MKNEYEKKPDAPELEIEKHEMQFPIPDNYYYSNAALVSMSNWDFRFSFSESRPKGEMRPGVGVVMTPAHAKAFVGVLIQNIQAYESKFGEIIIPVLSQDDAKEKPNAKPKKE